MCHDLFTFVSIVEEKTESRFFFLYKQHTTVNNFGPINFLSCRFFVGSKYVLLILFHRKRADTGLLKKSLLYEYYKHKNDNKKNIPIIPPSK